MSNWLLPKILADQIV